jgi:hypothetical protein
VWAEGREGDSGTGKAAAGHGGEKGGVLEKGTDLMFMEPALVLSPSCFKKYNPHFCSVRRVLSSSQGRKQAFSNFPEATWW